MWRRAATPLSLAVWALLAACGGPTPGAERAGDLQPASLGDPATAALVVGCWFLQWGTGPGGDVADATELPDSVRLRDEVVFGSPERLVTPATHPRGRAATDGGVRPWEASYLLNRWWIDDALLRLRFSDGEREEWRAVLTVESDELTGVAQYDGDAPRPAGTRQVGVRGTRLDCQF